MKSQVAVPKVLCLKHICYMALTHNISTRFEDLSTMTLLLFHASWRVGLRYIFFWIYFLEQDDSTHVYISHSNNCTRRAKNKAINQRYQMCLTWKFWIIFCIFFISISTNSCRGVCIIVYLKKQSVKPCLWHCLTWILNIKISHFLRFSPQLEIARCSYPRPHSSVYAAI